MEETVLLGKKTTRKIISAKIYDVLKKYIVNQF